MLWLGFALQHLRVVDRLWAGPVSTATEHNSYGACRRRRGGRPGRHTHRFSTSLGGRISSIFARLVEIPAALLVVAEIVVLFAGILARYVFHKPIVWSDELAGILFLWLAMLGAVIAFQRGEHMRMTAIVGMLQPRARAFLDVVAVAAALAFLLLVIHPAYEFAADEVYVTTPALEIANSWRAAALPVGIGLMLLSRSCAWPAWPTGATSRARSRWSRRLAGLMVLLGPALQPLPATSTS